MPRLSLMVVGAPKCGSTALYAQLATHPGLHGHVHREMPYFGRPDEVGRGWGFAVEKYFGAPADALVAKHTMAMYDDRALRLVAGSTAAVVAVVLRDPVPRAYSHYRYAVLRGWESAATFEEGLEREPERPVGSPPLARDLRYAGDGCYAPYVRTLLDAFTVDRRRVYTSEELRRDPQAVCSELFRLAGLAPHRANAAPTQNEGRAPRSARFSRAFLALQQPGSPLRAVASRYVPSRVLYRGRFLVNRLNERQHAVAPMSERTRRRLEQQFVGPNRELADLLGRELRWSS